MEDKLAGLARSPMDARLIQGNGIIISLHESSSGTIVKQISNKMGSRTWPKVLTSMHSLSPSMRSDPHEE